MQFSIQSVSDLKLNINISVPANELVSAYDKKVNAVAKQAKIDGFRPGKVPVAYIKKNYGPGIEAEVIESIVRNSFDSFCVEKKLEVAAVENVNVTQKELGKDLEFTVSVEVYPEISFADEDFIKTSVDKKIAEVKDQDVENYLQKFLKSQATWKDADVATIAKIGDKVVIDFKGEIDNKNIDAASAEDFELELGSNHLIPGFEDGIVGHKTNDEFKLNLTFPSDYHEAEYAGKPVVFTVTLKTVKHATLPEIDTDFCRRFGVHVHDENCDHEHEHTHEHVHGENCTHDHKTSENEMDPKELFRAKVKETIIKELNNKINADFKVNVLKSLRESKPLNVPQSAVDAEINAMIKQRQEYYKKYTGSNSINFDKEKLAEEARERVHTSLLVLAFIKQNELKVNRDSIRAKLADLIGLENVSEEILDLYSGDKRNMQEISALALEDLVVQKLSEKFSIVESNVSYDEVMNNVR